MWWVTVKTKTTWKRNRKSSSVVGAYTHDCSYDINCTGTRPLLPQKQLEINSVGFVIHFQENGNKTKEEEKRRWQGRCVWWRGHEKKRRRKNEKQQQLRYGKSFLERKRGEKKKKKKEEEEKTQQQKRTIPFRGTEIPKEKK